MASNAWQCLDQPGGCGCGCHRIAAGRKRSGKKSGPTKLWTHGMDARVRLGVKRGESLTSMAKDLHVTIGAVRVRVTVLSESLRTGWMTQNDVGRALGVTWRVTRRWSEEALISFSQHEGGRWWRVSEADVEAFVREHAGVQFNERKVVHPALRRLAETSAAVNRRRAGVRDPSEPCVECGDPPEKAPHFGLGMCSRCYHRLYARQKARSEATA